MKAQQARLKHNYAVRKGLITPGQQCIICGIRQSQVVKGSIIEHHDDYDKPYETITLCCSCHTKKHLGTLGLPSKEEDRNKRLYDFWKRNSPISISAVARIFHISQPRASEIIKQEEARRAKLEAI